MCPEPKLQHGRQRRFETTRWSLVLRARGPEGANSRQAVSELCRAYWWPVYAFFRSQGARENEAEDITQEFFGALDHRRDFSTVDPERGRFRTWLRFCAKRHLFNFRKHQKALKRDEQRVPRGGDAETAAVASSVQVPQDLLTPELDFNRSWALALHARVISRLRTHYAGLGKLEIFRSLEGILSGEGSEQSDCELARALGKEEGTLRVARFRVNKDVAALYRRYLRAEIGETVSNPEEIDDEIRDLLAALSQPLGIVERSRARDVRAFAGTERRAG